MRGDPQQDGSVQRPGGRYEAAAGLHGGSIVTGLRIVASLARTTWCELQLSENNSPSIQSSTICPAIYQDEKVKVGEDVSQ